MSCPLSLSHACTDTHTHTRTHTPTRTHARTRTKDVERVISDNVAATQVGKGEVWAAGQKRAHADVCDIAAPCK